MDGSRQIDYSAVVTFDGLAGLSRQIARRLGKRKGGMSYDQIRRWFAATPDNFVMDAVRRGLRERLFSVIDLPRGGERFLAL
jgi:hypothetical protein